MMLSAKLDQLVAFFTSSRSPLNKPVTQNEERLAPRSPTQLTLALKRSSIAPVKSVTQHEGRLAPRSPTQLAKALKRSSIPSDRLAPQSPTQLAKVLKRSSIPAVRRPFAEPPENLPSSRKRSRSSFSVYDDLEPQYCPEKRVRFDLSRNDIREFKTGIPARSRPKKAKGHVIWERHQPGDEVLMSGGVAAVPRTTRHDCTHVSSLYSHCR